MYRKIFSLLLTLVMVFSMTTMAYAEGETTTAVPEGRREITFWHSMGGYNLTATEAIVDAFNNSQDEIWLTASYQGNYDECLTKLKSAFLAGTAPDVFGMFELGSNYLANSGYVIPFEDMLAQDPVMELDMVVDALRSYYTINGKLQCFPYNPSTCMLYYNKTAFEKAGVEVPTTFEGFADVAEALTTKGGVRYASGLTIYGWFFENLLASMGGYYVNNENGRAGVATAVEYTESGLGAQIMETWKKHVDNGVVFNVGTKVGDSGTAFMSGDTALLFYSTASLTSVQDQVKDKFELGVQYMTPMVEGAGATALVGGGNIWMYKSGDEQRQKDAWEFVKFFASDPKWGAFFSQSTGYFAGRKDVYTQPEYRAYLDATPNAEVAIDQLLSTPMNNVTAGANVGCMAELRAIWQENFEMYLNDELTLEECLEEMRIQSNDAITMYNLVNGLVE